MLRTITRVASVQKIENRSQMHDAKHNIKERECKTNAGPSETHRKEEKGFNSTIHVWISRRQECICARHLGQSLIVCRAQPLKISCSFCNELGLPPTLVNTHSRKGRQFVQVEAAECQVGALGRCIMFKTANQPSRYLNYARRWSGKEPAAGIWSKAIPKPRDHAGRGEIGQVGQGS
jgi:hypothetical protein